ncbi:hypothetical protein POVCU1_064260, partial [Plasmodium ovale curtisi]
MENGKYTCDEIDKASKQVFNNIYLPYKTPILRGVIKIITNFKKKKEDGIDYKKLCKELSKYVHAQKRCINPHLKSSDKTTFKQQWKDIMDGLRTTYSSNNINRLCYWEGDKNKNDKEHVLGIYDEFRKFCIEKKQKETKSNLNFDECMLYLQWINTKKELFKALDPGYTNIEAYTEYFDIRDKCNYPWLVSTIPDVTCTQFTATKPKEIDGEKKSLGNSHLNPPDVSHSPQDRKKDVKSAAQPPSQGDVHIDKPKASDSDPKEPNQSAPPANANVSSNVHTVAQFSDMNITGTDISKSGHDSNIKRKYINFSDLPATFSGHKIPYTVRFPIHEKPSIFVDGYPVHVQRTQISRNPSNLYNTIRSSIPNHKQFQEPIVPFTKYSLILEHRDPPIYHFDDVLPPFPIITSGNKKLDRVVLEPAIPDASYFRSPSMIYTLVFLAIFTIISTFYLFSKYTPFGLLFSKKKKKKRLKRQLEIKKMPEES